MNHKKWQVFATPDANYFVLEVEGLPGATQAKGLKKVDSMVRDFIFEHTAEAHDGVEYDLHFRLPEDVNHALLEAQRMKLIADKTRKDAAQASTRAAKILRAQGFTVRDIGAMLGISFQRVQQFLSH